MSRLDTTETFIAKARLVHGNKYDYSKVEYVRSNQKVCIVCPIHGEFWQRPNSHLMGKGCDRCADERNGRKKRLTTESFIEKARAKHGNKYDYSKVEYVRSNQKVCIVCPTHGEFWQYAESHLAGRGCDRCADTANGLKKRITMSEFLERARKVHGNKYDYSKVQYTNADAKVLIICPEHGEFWQTPSHHLNRGDGCPVCRRIKAANSKTFTNEKFLRIAKEVHGEKYDYSKTIYKKGHLPVTIICRQHGEFQQMPKDHMRGQGCPVCGREKSDISRRHTLEEFIEKARKIHDDKYDYSKAVYVTNRTPITIICPKHGEFQQVPHEHLDGCGCPKCHDSSLERELIRYFDSKRVVYDYQKKFPWLGRQSLDFYFPDIKVALECQGTQHYEVAEGYMGGERGFRIRQGLDKRKLALCKANGIQLLYYDKSKNTSFLGEPVIKTKENLLRILSILREEKLQKK